MMKKLAIATMFLAAFAVQGFAQARTVNGSKTVSETTTMNVKKGTVQMCCSVAADARVTNVTRQSNLHVAKPAKNMMKTVAVHRSRDLKVTRPVDVQ